MGHYRGALNAAILLKNGDFGPPDLVRAYAWLNIAASQGNAGAEKLKEAVTSQLTREQIDEGQKLSAQLLTERV